MSTKFLFNLQNSIDNLQKYKWPTFIWHTTYFFSRKYIETSAIIIRIIIATFRKNIKNPHKNQSNATIKNTATIPKTIFPISIFILQKFNSFFCFFFLYIRFKFFRPVIIVKSVLRQECNEPPLQANSCASAP